MVSSLMSICLSFWSGILGSPSPDVRQAIMQFADPAFENMMDKIFVAVADEKLAMYSTEMLRSGYCITIDEFSFAYDSDKEHQYGSATAVEHAQRLFRLSTNIPDFLICRFRCDVGTSKVTQFGSAKNIVSPTDTGYGKIPYVDGYFMSFSTQCSGSGVTSLRGRPRSRRSPAPGSEEFSEKEYGVNSQVNGVKVEKADITKDTTYTNITNLFSGQSVPVHDTFEEASSYYGTGSGLQTLYSSLQKVGNKAGLDSGSSGMLSHLAAQALKESQSVVSFHITISIVLCVYLVAYLCFNFYMIYNRATVSTYKLSENHKKEKKAAEEKKKNKQREGLLKAALSEQLTLEEATMQLRSLDAIPESREELYDTTNPSSHFLQSFP